MEILMALRDSLISCLGGIDLSFKESTSREILSTFLANSSTLRNSNNYGNSYNNSYGNFNKMPSEFETSVKEFMNSKNKDLIGDSSITFRSSSLFS